MWKVLYIKCVTEEYDYLPDIAGVWKDRLNKNIVDTSISDASTARYRMKRKAQQESRVSNAYWLSTKIILANRNAVSFLIT